MALDARSEDTTVRLAASGDAAAFARLVEAHHGAMSRVAYVITGDVEATRDAVQSAWSLAWRRIGNLREPAQVRSWLVAIAANEARASLRRGRRSGSTIELENLLEAPGGSDPAEGIALVDLRRVLARLGPDDRTLLALRYVSGLDSTQIGAHLHVSPSGVRSRLARLLDKLRTELDHA
ncbi:MAG: sigma-70 family RNA polymerase sigma factor [Chloroflexota bacterium]